MPPEQLYTTVVEVGLADAAEVVQLASPEQFQALVDLGAWKKDALDPHATLEWLSAARGDDPEEMAPQRCTPSTSRCWCPCSVPSPGYTTWRSSPDPTVEGVTLDSADGRFRIELLVEGAEQAALRALLLDLTAEDPLGFSRLMESVRWEMPSELEETALRFRWARLSDLGFPDPESAAGLYSAVPVPDAPRRASESAEPDLGPAEPHPGRPRRARCRRAGERAGGAAGPLQRGTGRRRCRSRRPGSVPRLRRARPRHPRPGTGAALRRRSVAGGGRWCATRRSGASSRSAFPWGCG